MLTNYMNPRPMMATPLNVYVYRDAAESGDCTLGGVTSNNSQLLLCEAQHLRSLTEDQKPKTIVVERDTDGYMVAMPYEAYVRAAKRGDNSLASVKSGWAFGGNFVHSSDGRFPNQYPIKVHDRDMSKENR